MAEDPLAPRSRAANVSRRALIGGMTAAPFVGAPTIPWNPAAWEAALKAYTVAHYAHDAFMATTLWPAYAALDAALARSGLNAEAGRVKPDWAELRLTIRRNEARIRDHGGTRADVIRTRRADRQHAKNRAIVVTELRARRARSRLMRQHKVFELEEHGNDLVYDRQQALRALLLIPALDPSGLLLKIRLSYDGIFRDEDEHGLLRSIFADVERLIS